MKLLKKIVSSLVRYKILIIIVIFLIAFIEVAIWSRDHFISEMKSASSAPSSEPTPTPDLTTPSPSPTPTESNVLGASDNSDYVYKAPLPLPTPPPTLQPLPTVAPVTITTTTVNTSSTPNISSGNSNCTTAVGTPNSWYSDVYPNPPITAYNGSVTLIVYIRDCFKNTATVTDTLNISLSSGDPSTQVNGNNLPYSITTQNGQASFNVSSQIVGTVTLIVQDTTSSFTITNINNNNPSVNFVGSSTTTPTPSLTGTPSPTPLQSNAPTPTITPSQSNIPTPTPG